jgi:Holliday junction resolvasome RuvABC endonuclease subunit
MLRPTRITNPLLLGIDPSSTTIGYSIVEYDMATGLFYIVEASSFCAPFSSMLQCLLETSEDKYRRFRIIREFISRKLSEYNISDVYCEGAYLKRGRQTAYESLLGCIHVVRDAVTECSYTIPVTIVSASAAKEGMGVPGNSGDKLLMLNALKNKEHLIIPPYSGYVDELDQHAIDAVCIAICGGMMSYRVYNDETFKKKKRK